MSCFLSCYSFFFCSRINKLYIQTMFESEEQLNIPNCTFNVRLHIFTVFCLINCLTKDCIHHSFRHLTWISGYKRGYLDMLEEECPLLHPLCHLMGPDKLSHERLHTPLFQTFDMDKKWGIHRVTRRKKVLHFTQYGI